MKRRTQFFQWAKIKPLRNRHILIVKTFLGTAGVFEGKFNYTCKYINEQNLKQNSS